MNCRKLLIQILRYTYDNMERLLTTSVERDGAEPVLLCSNTYDSQARMLMPDLGRTTTMDPLAEKYYPMSPYLWCGGNPVKHTDKNGMDYHVECNENNREYTIKAIFYVFQDDLYSAKESIDFWNKLSGQYRINDYYVNFDLSYSVVDHASSNNPSKTSMLRYKVDNDDSGMANSYQIVADTDKRLKSEQNGKTIDGKKILVRDSQSKTMTGAHEIGHAIGLVHNRSVHALMYECSSERLNNQVFHDEILQIINNAKAGKPSFEKKDNEFNYAGKGYFQLIDKQ